MLGSILTTAVLIVGIDVQFPETQDKTAVECHIRIEPQLLESMKRGEEITSGIPSYVTKPVRAFKITVDGESSSTSTFSQLNILPRSEASDSPEVYTATERLAPTESDPDWTATRTDESPGGAYDIDSTVLQVPGSTADENPYGINTGEPPAEEAETTSPPSTTDEPATDPYSLLPVLRESSATGDDAPASPYATQPDPTAETTDEPTSEPATETTPEPKIEPAEDANHTANKLSDPTITGTVGYFSDGTTPEPANPEPAGVDDSSGSPSDDFHKDNPASDAALTGGKPMSVFTVALLAFFASLGLNIYLVWLAVSYRDRCRRMITNSDSPSDEDPIDEYDYRFEEKAEHAHGVHNL